MPTEHELSVAKQQRKIKRTQITKDINKASSEFANVDDKNMVAASALLLRLKAYHDILEPLNITIQAGLTGEDLSGEIVRCEDYEVLLMEAISLLEVKVDAAKTSGVSKGETSTDAKSIPQRKLPELRLTRFGGDPLKWEEFWDDFVSSVDSRKEISVIDKFKLLKGCLDDEAFRVVDGYLLTNANYKQVKEVLLERFGDPEVAIFAHLEALLDIKPASHELQQLMRVQDECEMHIRSLVALGLDESTFGLVFTPIVLSKLPRFVKMELHRRNETKKWSLGKLRELLKSEISARDKSERCYNSTPGLSNGSKPKSVEIKKKKPTASVLVMQGSKKAQSSMQSKAKCIFCSGQHQNWNCDKYKTAEDRVKRIAGRCFICLSDRHMRRQCTVSRQCYYCKRTSHHSSLCQMQFGSASQVNNGQASVVQAMPQQAHDFTSTTMNPGASVFTPSVSTTTTIVQNAMSAVVSPRRGVTILESAMVVVSGTKSTKARVLFDNGSTMSFITRRLSRDVGSQQTGKEVTSIGRFGDNCRKTTCYNTVVVTITLLNGSKQDVELNEVDHVTTPLRMMPLDLSKYPFLKNLDLADQLTDRVVDADVDVLIGLDNYYRFIGPEIQRFKGVVFKQSSFGVIASGCAESDNQVCATQAVAQQMLIVEQHVENFDLQKFCKLEEIGINDPPGETDDEVAAKYFNDTYKVIDGRYQVRLPYKVSEPDLPDNRNVALRRLKSLHNRIKDQPQVLDKYTETFQQQLNLGMIEHAPEVPQGRVHYLPHHCVITPEKITTKMRIVFDASAKANRHSSSLNECLYRGPVLLNDLAGLLMRFRLSPIAVVSDVEKAFLQISIQEEDRDVVRFLWLKDPQCPPVGDNIVTFRFSRVPFGVISSPWLLGAVCEHFMRSQGTATAMDILRNCYVDNVLSGKATLSEAREYYEEATKLFMMISMNLRQWYSNCAEFMESVAEEHRGSGLETSVLGLKWNIVRDDLRCPVGYIAVDSMTKRHVLKSIASVFDPCGWLCPVLIRGKIMMQQLWKAKLEWDADLPVELKKDWSNLCADLEQLKEFKLPRVLKGSVGEGDASDCQLHGFCDASAKAFAAVIYLRRQGPTGVSTDLVFAKARVAPVKVQGKVSDKAGATEDETKAQGLTIPRLELLAAVIGARLMKFVEKELQLPLSKRVLWSDSKCVLHWLQRDSVSTVFVRNRINEIRANKLLTFRYVPTDENPADLPSRGVKFKEFSESKLWWEGPSWLRESSKKWPENSLGLGDMSASIEAESNLKAETSLVTHPVVQKQDVDGAPFSLPRYGDLDRLLRITAYFFRFLDCCLGRSFETARVPTAIEVQNAQYFWDKKVQKHFFRIDEPEMKTTVKNLGLYEDEHGIIRCTGRFVNAEDLSPGSKHPILLPGVGHYTVLVLKDCHERVCHAGLKHTLSTLRQRYWICHARLVIKRVLWDCWICRKYSGGPFRIPDPPSLPDFRSSVRRPFSCVGLDYLGPLYLLRKDKAKKVWISLFTCAAIRAIHLEVVSSCNALDFLMCLRRFVAAYGVPTIIVSDNAKQFKTTDDTQRRMWREIQNDDMVQRFSSKKGITWKYTTAMAPWMGGFYERLVLPVKQALKRTLDNRSVTLVELQTIVAEIAATLNNRPLLYNESEVGEGMLTPAHLLMRSTEQFPQMRVDDDEEFRIGEISTAEKLLDQWKASQKILNHFWNVWQNQYLLSLREAHAGHRHQQRNTSEIEARTGTAVLIKEKLPRGMWRMGRIQRLIPSRDGLYRSAEVRLHTGKILCRPLKLLCPLEFCPDDRPTVSRQPVVVSEPRRNTARTAAVEAQQRFRSILAAEELDEDDQVLEQ